jgi:hypothetical protein
MAADTYALIRRAMVERKRVHAAHKGHPRRMCPHVIGAKGGQERALFFQFAGSSIVNSSRAGTGAASSLTS